METFDQEAIAAIGGRSEDARCVDEACKRLAARRAPRVEATGDLAKSKLAWKVSVLEQSLRYRIVELLQGTIREWNSRNVLCSIVLARAVSETNTAIIELHRKILRSLENGDFRSLNDLIEIETFVTRDPEWVREFPHHQATNIITKVQRLDKEIPGYEHHYGMLSEISHPNSMGCFQFFATTNSELRIAEFSTQKRNVAPILSSILVSCTTALLAEKALDELAAAIPAISKLVPEQ